MKTNLILAAALALAAPASALENTTLSVSKIKDLNVRIYGFVETDVIHDTTQGFTEEQGNNLVPTRTPAGKDAPAAFAGQNGRTLVWVG
jgi:hypothetical protein